MLPTAHGIVSQGGIGDQPGPPALDGTPIQYGETGWGVQSPSSTSEVGWRFTVGSSDLLATRLSLYQAGGATETVRLYRVSDQTLLASALIASAGSWAEAPITPVTLAAGEDYAVTRYAGGASRAYDQTPVRVVSGVSRSRLFNPAVTLVGGVYNPNGGFPSTAGSAGYSVNVHVAPPSVGYRFYRLRFTAANGGTQLRLRQIQLRSAIGGPDRTGTGVPWEDSLSGSTYPSSNLFLSNSDMWISASGVVNASVYYDFGTHNPQTIVQYAVTAGNSASQTPSGWVLEASNDLLTWDALHTVTGETGWSNGEQRVFTV